MNWKIVRFVPFVSLLFSLIVSGCGGKDSPESASDAYTSSMPMSGAASSSSSSSSDPGMPAPNAVESAKAPSSNAASVGTLVQAVSTTPRKIIYTATVNLVVEELTAAQTKLTQLVKANGGYIAETNVGGASGSQRSGTWKVRVPVEKYEAFMAGATRLGELQTVQANSQDVTAEFYDVSARIKNKQVEEQRLQRLLQTATGKLTEILQVERELSRVRGEIEQLQGRIRVLANLSSLTTVTLTLNEIKNYVPPAPPTFVTQIARQFESSLGGVRDFGKGLILVVVALVPWAIVLAIFGVPLWLKFRPRKVVLPKNE